LLLGRVSSWGDAGLAVIGLEDRNFSRVSDEFETCPIWVPGKDKFQRFVPIILKVIGFERFDHSASWPAKVRNVSRLGSQNGSTPTTGANPDPKLISKNITL
jgi:hypothetical protein